MKRVLIIGANSYIGQKLHEYITNNCSNSIVTMLVSASDGSWEKVDFKGYDTVIHLAAIVHKKENKKMKELYDKVNHRLAVKVAKLAKNSGVKQFIFMSTAAVYGKITGYITKDTIPQPTTYYGISKLAAENDIQGLQGENFKVTIIRPPLVYGDGCKGNYAKLKKAANYFFIFPDIHNKRSVVNINKLNQFITQTILDNLVGIHFPQDDEFFDTCKAVVDERKAINKNTILIPGFIFAFIINRINILRKIFGDFYYLSE